MDPGAIYDKMVAEAGAQTMSREDFVKECKRLSDPHLMQRDLGRITMERGRRRTLGMYRKRKVDNALKED
jgi:hypothetical protein